MFAPAYDRTHVCLARRVALAMGFRLVQTILLPVAAIAYGPFVMTLIRFSRSSGTSATALASLYTRYMQHQLGTRQDAPCVRLMRGMPHVSPLGLWLETAPTLIAHRLTGYVPRIYRYPYDRVPPLRHHPAARTTFYDAAVARHLSGVAQLVVLGAGFDTRVYRLPPAASVRCFEMDQPQTQAFKRRLLQQAGIDTTRVTYVPADFREDDWFARLSAAGFAPDRPSVFLWEAVTPYLDREAVEGTLRRIAGTAPGSVIAFDYFSTTLLASRSLFMRYVRLVFRLLANGEHFGGFGLNTVRPARQQVAAFLARCGLTLEDHQHVGEETGQRRAKAGFVLATVQGPH